MTDTNRYRVRFEYDPEPDLTLCDPDGHPLPGSRETYEANPITPGGGPALSYGDYCRTYGDPDRHVVLGCVVDRQCPTCGTWEHAASLWGIDFMDTDQEVSHVEIGHSYTVNEALALPGYLSAVVGELLAEVCIPSGKAPDDDPHERAADRARSDDFAATNGKDWT